MTPCEIEVLIHCYVSPAPHPRIDSGAVSDAINTFLSEGLIEPVGQANRYDTTPRGVAHISQLCSTPFPVQKWVNEAGEVIGE
jgi:hypothetical protein